jgi:hypothetical protein
VSLKLLSLAVKEKHGVKAKPVALWPLNIKITVLHSANGDISFLLNFGNFTPHCMRLCYRRECSSEVEFV